MLRCATHCIGLYVMAAILTNDVSRQMNITCIGMS